MKTRRKTQMFSWTFVKSCVLELLVNPKSTRIIAFLLFVFEVVLNIFIVKRVKYTEIDWTTYMQQVECFLNGTRDYTKITGDTGPIVYPSGHLLIYSTLFYVTNSGKNILFAQYIFIGLYLLNLLLVFRMYHKFSKVPPFALGMMCFTSYRIHSIYSLRLFNDPIAMCLLYGSVNLLLDHRWRFASLLFSLAVSVKMNILLFAPGLLLLFLENLSLIDTMKNLSICALVQGLVSFPFLISHPIEYISRSFNLGRIFLHKWTVNWRFVPESLFVSPPFHIFLLAMHLSVLLFFFGKRYWFSLRSLTRHSIKSRKLKDNLSSNHRILITLFLCNFIGICFARSLHYQFYVWYYHSLPLLLWSTPFANVTRLCILGFIELCWNVYPSTSWSSLTLLSMHIIILFGLWRGSSVDFGARNRNKS